MPLAEFDVGKADELLQTMGVEARRLLAGGTAATAVSERRQAFMRYVGQGHEVGIALPAELEEVTAASLRAAFEAEYAELFSRAIPHAAIEILNWSVLVTAERGGNLGALPGLAAAEGVLGSRKIFDGGRVGWMEVPVRSRGQLVGREPLSGPAIIVEAETSTFVPASFTASVSGTGFIIMQRKVS
jgi:N-methylhydantoinase A